MSKCTIVPAHGQAQHLKLSSCDLHDPGAVQPMIRAGGCHLSWRHGTQQSNHSLDEIRHLQEGLPGSRHLQIDDGERYRQQPARHSYQRSRRHSCHMVFEGREDLQSMPSMGVPAACSISQHQPQTGSGAAHSHHYWPQSIPSHVEVVWGCCSAQWPAMLPIAACSNLLQCSPQRTLWRHRHQTAQSAPAGRHAAPT